jgi:hypothetical protein
MITPLLLQAMSTANGMLLDGHPISHFRDFVFAGPIAKPKERT